MGDGIIYQASEQKKGVGEFASGHVEFKVHGGSQSSSCTKISMSSAS